MHQPIYFLSLSGFVTQHPPRKHPRVQPDRTGAVFFPLYLQQGLPAAPSQVSECPGASQVQQVGLGRAPWFPLGRRQGVSSAVTYDATHARGSSGALFPGRTQAASLDETWLVAPADLLPLRRYLGSPH